MFGEIDDRRAGQARSDELVDTGGIEQQDRARSGPLAPGKLVTRCTARAEDGVVLAQRAQLVGGQHPLHGQVARRARHSDREQVVDGPGLVVQVNDHIRLAIGRWLERPLLHGDQLAFDGQAIAAADIVFDVVAVPSETPLILRARAEDKHVITGLEVIAIQALEQFVLYTGVRPTDEQFQKAVEFARSSLVY